MRAKFDQKIRKKQQEIQDIEHQIADLQQKIRDAKTYIQAMEDSKRMFPKDDGTDHDSDDEPVTLKEGSALARARGVIQKAGKPLHIDEILKQMGVDVNKKTRVSLAGSIAGYARKKRVFAKADGLPNTFSLIGMADSSGETGKNNPPLSIVGGTK